MKRILALDQGTTSSRSLIIDDRGRVLRVSQREFKQFFPKPGWVEHDPEQIWQTQLATIRAVLKRSENIDGVGITNQRETAILWNRKTGKPIGKAIVWQDRRTSEVCEKLRRSKHAGVIRSRTGLEIDSYFSGTKIAWLLDHIKGARKAAMRGELAFGTVDTWLIWKLTQGRSHITDVSNASRTMLFNLKTGAWDKTLCRIFRVPENILPNVVASSGKLAVCKIPELSGVPISGIAGDQQAALFGQLCFKPGESKNTYGTGCFMLMNTGDKVVRSHNGLLSTVAWQLNGQPIQYALEGGVFIGGALTQWLRDGLEIIPRSRDIEKLARSVPDSHGVVIVPAFVGLGAPHWDQFARGAIFGITRGTTKAHIARAAEEATALQVLELVRAMEHDSGKKLSELRVDGGGSADALMLQIQADLLGVSVRRPAILETTALGAAYLAGLGCGVWKNENELRALLKTSKVFRPKAKSSDHKHLLHNWSRAIEKSRGWLRD